jgi:hypothetical protein
MRPGVALGPLTINLLSGRVRDVRAQDDSRLRKKLEHQAKLDGGFSVFDVRSKLLAHAGGRSQVVLANARVLAYGSKQQGKVTD